MRINLPCTNNRLRWNMSCPLCAFVMSLPETARLRPADSVPELVILPVVVMTHVRGWAP